LQEATENLPKIEENLNDNSEDRFSFDAPANFKGELARVVEETRH